MERAIEVSTSLGSGSNGEEGPKGPGLPQEHPARDLGLVSASLSHYYCCCLAAKSCLTLCDPMDCSPPGCSVHVTSQARILEWVAISFSRGSSRPRDQTQVNCLAGEFFSTEPAGKPLFTLTLPVCRAILLSECSGTSPQGLSLGERLIRILMFVQ